MRRLFVSLSVAVLVTSMLAAAAKNGMSPSAALAKLQRGNVRAAKGAAVHPRQDKARRRDTAKAQQPFAVVLACSDSRVAPELVFDQGMGDLFVVRVAGNVVDDNALGSIEYAVEHLGASLVVVLGHERCGAVKAALDGGEAPGHIGSLVHAIQPAIDETRGAKGDSLDLAVRANVARVVRQLRESEPLLKKAVDEKKIEVVGMEYDLDSGKVELLR